MGWGCSDGDQSSEVSGAHTPSTLHGGGGGGDSRRHLLRRVIFIATINQVYFLCLLCFLTMPLLHQWHPKLYHTGQVLANAYPSIYLHLPVFVVSVSLFLELAALHLYARLPVCLLSFIHSSVSPPTELTPPLFRSLSQWLWPLSLLLYFIAKVSQHSTLL